MRPSLFQRIRQALGTDRSAFEYALVAIPRIQSYTGQVLSVMDLGCGLGQWLAAWRLHGATRLLGMDRKRYRRGYIEPWQYSRFNLGKPCIVYEKFDLAMSLEVAEHLPDRFGRQLVDILCRCAPFVLFSAATPGQGGWGHVNERPHEWWDANFADHGFFLHVTFTNMPSMDCPWYSDNMRLYIRSEYVKGE